MLLLPAMANSSDPLKRLTHFDESQVNEMMNSPDWMRAIFVRNPHERMLSAYLDKGCNVSF